MFMMADYKRPEDVETAETLGDTLGQPEWRRLLGTDSEVPWGEIPE